jgi:hypothetical protein
MRLVLALAVLVSAAPARAEVVATGYIDNNVAGDVQSGRPGVGASIGYYLRGRIGFELDAELHGHFFRDQDVADLAPSGVDINTGAALASANVVAPYCLQSPASGRWCPYATGGLGMIYASFEGITMMPGADGGFTKSQANLAVNAGAGVMHALTRLVGFRVDARYLHAFVDESATAGGYFKDYGFWRVSAGVTFGFPSW